MKAMFIYTLRRNLGQTLAWGLSLAALAVLIITSYELVLRNEEQIKILLNQMPAAIKAMIGDVDRFMTPSGYLDARFFAAMPLFGGIFGAVTGSGLLKADEETGRLDLMMAYPLSRRTVFFSRVLALLTVMMTINVFIWIGMAIGTAISPGEFSLVRLWLPLVCVFAYMAVCFATALLLSLLLPSRRMAGTVSAILVVASYILVTIGKVNPNLSDWIQLLPLNWYQGGRALDGFEWSPFVKLVLVSLVQILAAYSLFEMRDIRVAGEGTLDWRRVLSPQRWTRVTKQTRD